MDTACPYLYNGAVELFHLLNRGVEKRAVALDETDYVRFIHDLYAFNDKKPVDPNHRFKEFESAQERKPLVAIHAYCVMPDHYHLLVSEIEEAGISIFMRKLNMGYAKYFNEKYNRSGVLWQGTFRKVTIQRDAHFLYIPFYIHLNALDMAMPEWRDGNVKSVDKALKYLSEYRWSSYLDYIGDKNFPSLLDRELLSDVLGSAKQQKQTIADIISNPELAERATRLE